MLQRWFDNCRNRATFHHTWCRRTERCLVTIRDLEPETGFVRIGKLAQSWTPKFVIMKIVALLKFRSDLCFLTEPPFGLELWMESKKYVNDSTQTIEHEEHRALGKYIAKARPRMKWTITLTPVSVPLGERKWVDVNPGSYHECYVTSKEMIRQRHITIFFGQQTEQWNLKILLKKTTKGKGWPLNDWISTLAKGGGTKNIFQYCVNPNSPYQFLYLRAIQRHSRDNAVDHALQDNVLLPKGFTEYIYHVRNVSEIHSIITSGLIPGGQSLKRGRQSVFFTTVNMMEFKNSMEETLCDLTKPKIVPYKNIWKPYLNTVYWCSF